MRDWNSKSPVFFLSIWNFVGPYLWGIETYRQGPWILTALPLDRTYERLKPLPVIIWHNLLKLNRTYEWYFAFAELIVLYEYYELFR